jgi:hypothetical protein
MERLLEQRPVRNKCIPIRWTPEEAEIVEYGAWMRHEWSVSGYMRDIVLDYVKQQGVPAEYERYLERRANLGKDKTVAVENKA